MVNKEILNSNIEPGQSVLVQSTADPDQLSIYTVAGVTNGMARLRLFASLTANKPRKGINIGLKNLTRDGGYFRGSLRFEILPEDDEQSAAGQQITAISSTAAGFPLVFRFSREQAKMAIGI